MPPTAPALESSPLDSCRATAEAFRLLADPVRLTIVRAIADADAGERNVTELCAAVAQTQPAVSHHLALLRLGRLVECRRSGKRNFYRLVPDVLRQLAAELEGLAAAAPGED